PTLRGSGNESGSARSVFEAQQAGAISAAVFRWTGIHGSRDADDAADCGRGGGASVQDASQHAGYGSVSAHRAGTLFETADGRRIRSRVRDQPQLLQRGSGVEMES